MISARSGASFFGLLLNLHLAFIITLITDHVEQAK